MHFERKNILKYDKNLFFRKKGHILSYFNIFLRSK